MAEARACLRGLHSSAPSEEAPQFRLITHLDESYERADIELLGSDGGARFSVRVDGGASSIVRSRSWHQGPGGYAVSMKYVRADGGTGTHRTSFEMKTSDVRADGYAMFFASQQEPELRLEIVERTPTGLHLEPRSKISREGNATYAFTNTTGRQLFPGFARLVLQRREADGWREVAPSYCIGAAAAVLEPGERLVLEAGSGACLSTPLSPGLYRHSLQLKTFEPAPAWETFDDASEVTRSIEVAAVFDTAAIGAFSSHPLADVPSSELRLEIVGSGPDGFVAEVLAPDGRSACVCPGSVVGREGMRATWGIGGPCLSADLDASVIQCEPIDRERRGLGDHPPFPH